MQCFLCEKEIDKSNNSKEHIFLNSIGGNETVSNFICIGCNNSTGTTWDSEVNKITSILANIFHIKRHRGDVRPSKIELENGKIAFLHKDRISTDDIQFEIENFILTVTGPSKKRVAQFIEKLIKDDVIELDVSNITKYSQQESKDVELRAVLAFKIPPLNSDFSKSLIKSCIALLAKNKFNLQHCNLAIDFLNSKIEPCLSHIYDIEFIKDRPFGTPFHCIEIFSRNNEIIAYVELFGYIRYLVNLSDNYNEAPFSYSYSLDPQTGEKILLDFDNTMSNVKKSLPWEALSDLMHEYSFKIEVEKHYILNFKKFIKSTDKSYANFNKIFNENVPHLLQKMSKLKRPLKANSFIKETINYITKELLKNK